MNRIVGCFDDLCVEEDIESKYRKSKNLVFEGDWTLQCNISVNGEEIEVLMVRSHCY